MTAVSAFHLLIICRLTKNTIFVVIIIVNVMFGFGGVFNRKARQFDYRPRYYDPEQERREQRRRELLGADYQDRYKTEEERKADYVPGRYIRDNIKTRRGIGTSSRNNSSFGIRIVLIIVLICLAAWWIMRTDFFTEFLTKWLGA